MMTANYAHQQCVADVLGFDDGPGTVQANIFCCYGMLKAISTQTETSIQIR